MPFRCAYPASTPRVLPATQVALEVSTKYYVLCTTNSRANPMNGDRVSWHAVVGIETRLVVVAMPAPDAPEDQQAHDNHNSPDDRPAGRRLRLSEQRLLGVVGEPLGVGAGGGILSCCYHSFH